MQRNEKKIIVHARNKKSNVVKSHPTKKTDYMEKDIYHKSGWDDQDYGWDDQDNYNS